MNFSRLFIVLAACAFCFESALAADDLDSVFPSHTAYVGLNMGGGWTEWKYLVDRVDINVSPSTPTKVTEGGPSWGAVIGYDVNKNFALEWQYMQFANANIFFSPYSGHLYHNVSSMVSHTDAYSFSLKFLAQMGKTNLRAFAAVGPGVVHRQDVLARQHYAVEPYMSTGLVYNFTRHWMLESGFQYYTGFGVSEMGPVLDFIPFAWDAYGRLAYQF